MAKNAKIVVQVEMSKFKKLNHVCKNYSLVEDPGRNIFLGWIGKDIT